MKNKIIAVVVLIVVAGGAFYFGVQNGKASAAAAATAARSSFTRGAGGAGTRMGGGAVAGQVVSVDSNSLSISLPGGGSQVIFFTPTTPITKTVSGSISDLTSGTNILVTGTANSDGSESATNIQIRPAGFGTTTRATTTTTQ